MASRVPLSVIVLLAVGFIAVRGFIARSWTTPPTHQEVSATVTGVRTECIVAPKSAGSVVMADAVDCRDALALPVGANERLFGHIRIDLDYLSPADGQRHSGHVFAPYPEDRALADLPAGAAFPVMASLTEPGQIERVWVRTPSVRENRWPFTKLHQKKL